MLALAGFGILLGIFVDWAANGFGALSREYLAILGLTLAGLGVQTVFASFFLSVLGLRSDFVPASDRRELAGVPLDAHVDQVQVLTHPLDGES